MDELRADVSQLKKDIIKIQIDLRWVKSIGLFIAAAVVGQLIIKLFT